MRPFGDVMLGSIELFCLCAQAESFTAAARRAGLTPAAVSRSIARLEARLGVRLFARSTRQVRLTDAGRDYYEECHGARHVPLRVRAFVDFLVDAFAQ